MKISLTLYLMATPPITHYSKFDKNFLSKLNIVVVITLLIFNLFVLLCIGVYGRVRVCICERVCVVGCTHRG